MNTTMDRRTWTDAQLRDAVEESQSWRAVARALGLKGTSAGVIRTVKRHVKRLGLDALKTPHLPSLTSEVFSEPVQPTMLRVAAPAMAMAWFALRGCAVALPVEPQEYDLLVTTKKGIQRVQVKSSTLRDTAGRWSVGVGRCPYILDKSAGKMPYDPESLDLFFIVVGDGGIYLIPSAVLAGRVRIYVESYAPYRVGDASRLL
jgi:hypothetical protein